ncbi:hypothetical protein [Haloprofundus salilacus]|uniref:DUF7835 family putative zinc beta-ribbon protein n=1 Tax=Haloprofundus salilacus TaxID=2876190 RepID=UPI001CCEAD78|nr:hypothetical protein [Haloprofundus salilacus]
MATKPEPDGVAETCDRCGRETTHNVRVEIRTESQKRENAEFSREPYRISVCGVCGTEKTQRMNNA